jgi:hypothetical protein
VRIRQISLSFTMLIAALSMTGCTKSVLPPPVNGENFIIITKKTQPPPGCTVQLKSGPTLKDPIIRVGMSEHLIVSADSQNYQLSFPGGSPLTVSDPLVPAGTIQSYPINFWAKSCANAAAVFGRWCSYTLDIYDPYNVKCDPIVHVTK